MTGPRKAVLAAIELPKQHFPPDVLLDELDLLLGNLGIAAVGRVIQRRSAPDPAFLIGRGKAEELKAYCAAAGASLLVCNETLSPGQKINLERVTGAEVWDRPFVIMKIFERRARTSEAKLQIEMALCRYEIPHLKGLGEQMSRLGGGIGTRGPGETEFERHRRKLERRVRDIAGKLETIKTKRRLQRDRRRKMSVPVLSLVGYTNSGKSSLLRALSGDAALVVEDRLFSTLDTFIRKVRLPSGEDILVADTVGFIRDLPPGLVAAFRTTLEEIANSEFVLLVLDVSDPDMKDILPVVEETLLDIGAGEIPRLFVLNKTDLLSESSVALLEEHFSSRGEKVVSVSALQGAGLPRLLRAIEDFLEQGRTFQQERSVCHDA